LTKTELIATAKRIAAEHGLDPALVCAVCEQESSWDTDAIRLEQGFYVRYVKPQKLGDAVEAACRAVSFGLMQVMGQVAREAGYRGDFATLCEDPAEGIRIGCVVLRGKIARAGNDVTQGLLAWNGGSRKEYPVEVLMRMDKYR
jgi:soluble lytic murein transglycosylase-like protein